eukprot:scaffold27941_cov58-Phaeocystis_antarctica.AAC.6
MDAARPRTVPQGVVGPAFGCTARSASCSTRLVTVGATRTHDRRDGPRLLRGAAPTVDDGDAPHSLGVRCHPARQQVQRRPGAQPPPTHTLKAHVH